MERTFAWLNQFGRPIDHSSHQKDIGLGNASAHTQRMTDRGGYLPFFGCAAA
jgi:hypothetical protein